MTALAQDFKRKTSIEFQQGLAASVADAKLDQEEGDSGTEGDGAGI